MKNLLINCALAAKKKKIFTLLLAVAASVGTMFAGKVQIGDLYYNLDATNRTAEVTYKSYNNYKYNEGWNVTIANIPASVTYNSVSYSVTSIGEYAFAECSSLTSITIPNSVTSIGDRAFWICSSLTSITIPNGVTSIGSYAFCGCDLTSVTIPNSVTSIGGYAFQGCSSLTSVTIPNSVTSIVNGAFLYCSSLTSITIPNSVTSIGDRAFAVCSSLTSVTIPNSVTKIGDAAFSACSSLTSITIPNSVTSIGDAAFGGCSSLTSITIPESVTSIGERAFEGCNNITSVTWNAKNCNSYNFGSQVTSFEFGNEVEVIPSSLCQGMTKLTSVTIPNSVTSIGGYAFQGCSSLTSVTIPNSVTSIREYAFSGCSSLTSVTIPNSVTWIGKEAFYECSSLTSVTINSDAIVNKAYTSSSNLSNIFGSQVTKYIIGTNVKGIGSYAFCGCDLTSVTIPNSVTSIGGYAFQGCSSLTSITIPNSVTSIGDRAFAVCSSLTSITIPNSVTSIGDRAFFNCSSLRSINVDSNNPNYSSVDGVLFNKDKTTLVAYPGGKQGAYTIPNSVTSIREYAFSGCSSLTSVTIGNSVTSIGGYAFGECESLKTVVLGSSVKVLEAAAFAYCSSIETITCYSMRPPTVNQDALYGLDYSTIVYVPADYLNTYKMHDAWGLYDVRPLGATSAETEDVKITPSENEANVTWPSVNGAATYELVIKDKDGNIVCTLIFNANGQLTSIAFNAPSRNGAPAQTQSAGFSFTITGLDSGTGYDLTLTAKDNSGNTIEETTIPFQTNWPEGIENVQSDEVQSTKVVRDGQVLILRNGKTYTMQGQEVK